MADSNTQILLVNANESATQMQVTSVFVILLCIGRTYARTSQNTLIGPNLSTRCGVASFERNVLFRYLRVVRLLQRFRKKILKNENTGSTRVSRQRDDRGDDAFESNDNRIDASSRHPSRPQLFYCRCDSRCSRAAGTAGC